MLCSAASDSPLALAATRSLAGAEQSSAAAAGGAALLHKGRNAHAHRGSRRPRRSQPSDAVTGGSASCVPTLAAGKLRSAAATQPRPRAAPRRMPRARPHDRSLAPRSLSAGCENTLNAGWGRADKSRRVRSAASCVSAAVVAAHCAVLRGAPSVSVLRSAPPGLLTAPCSARGSAGCASLTLLRPAAAARVRSCCALAAAKSPGRAYCRLH